MRFYVANRIYEEDYGEQYQADHVYYICRDDEPVNPGSSPTRWLIWYSTDSKPKSDPHADVNAS